MEVVEIANCLLIRGDAQEILPNLPKKSVDMIFVDPPYGHRNNDAGDLQHRREAALGLGPAGAPRPIANDGREEADALVRFLFAEAKRLLPPGAVMACCCGGGGTTQATWTLWMDEFLGLKATVVWDKGNGMGWHYRRAYEVVLVGQRPGGKGRWYDTSRRITNVIGPSSGIKRATTREGLHPTPKPTSLPNHFLQLHSLPGHVVLDPCMGGGSTAEAAIRSGRKFLGIELDTRFFDMTCARVERVCAELGIIGGAETNQNVPGQAEAA